MAQRVQRVTGALAGLVPLTALVWGCNLVLGIEEQGVRPAVSAPTPEAGVSSDAATNATCTKDDDCLAPDACYTPHCDTSSGRCWYGLCEIAGASCAAGRCDPASRTCEGATSYGFRTTSYAATVAPACVDAADCVAAIWPFLFIGTSQGVTAVFVDDPLAAGARTIPVSGFEGRVGRLVASGERLWIVGASPSADAGAPKTIPIGYVDVPSDPTVRGLDAKTEELELPSPPRAFAAPNGGLYLSVGSGAPQLSIAAALVTPPLPPAGRFVLATDPGTTGDGVIPLHPAAGLPTSSAGVVVASSADRLIVHEHPSSYFIVADPASASSRVEASLDATFPSTVAPSTFAQGREGALLGTGAVPMDPANDCGCTTVTRARWLLSKGDDVALDQASAVDLDSQRRAQLGGAQCHVCQGGYPSPKTSAAVLDEKTAMVAVLATSETGSVRTSVSLVTRDPASADPRRRVVIPVDELPGNLASDRIAAAADRGRGFLVISDVANRARISLFDARCEGGP